MEQHSNAFIERASAAMADDARARNFDRLGVEMPRMRYTAVKAFGDFSRLRDEFKAIRQHTLEHLSHYLQQYVDAAREQGAQIHFASDADSLNRTVLEICAGVKAKRVIKGKSMITEETGLNPCLEEAGLAVRETDLGEYIIQEAGETPSHIVGPALHKTEAEIRELFLERHALGERDLAGPPEMVAEARQILRSEFLAGDVGIIGSNALIAETGYSLLVTNEGNGDLCANLPRVMVICTSIDRVLPRSADAIALLRLLARSTTGQSVTSYSSFYGAPQRDGDLDGPVEIHVVLLDNGRSELLAGDYGEMLQCIRCGACLNHCPVYMSAGGHAYGWVYPGPMGSVLTPLLTSLEASEHLPNACTACGRCEEVCPGAIPLPDLLRDLRAEQFGEKIGARRWRRGMQIHAWLARRPVLYRRLTGVAVRLIHFLGKRRGVLRRLPLAGGWLQARDLPTPAAGETFQRQYRRGKPSQ